MRQPPLHSSSYPPDPTANSLLHQRLDRYHADKHYTVEEQLQGIYHAVQWSETLIVTLAVLYVTLLVTTVVCRRSTYIQASVLALCALGVLASQPLNAYGARHWRSITSQPYFDDPNGLFITLLWSVPLSLIALTAVINLLVSSSQLLISVKVKQLTRQRQQRIQQQTQQPDAVNGSSNQRDDTLRQRRAAASRVGTLD